MDTLVEHVLDLAIEAVPMVIMLGIILSLSFGAGLSDLGEALIRYVDGGTPVDKTDNEEVAGFYDGSGRLLCSWTALVNDYGMNVEKSIDIETLHDGGVEALQFCQYVEGSSDNSPASILADLFPETKKVVFPDDVEKIGDGSFCPAIKVLLNLADDRDFCLEEVELNKVKEIGEYAFAGNKIFTISIPKETKVIKLQAFEVYLDDLEFAENGRPVDNGTYKAILQDKTREWYVLTINPFVVASLYRANFGVEMNDYALAVLLLKGHGLEVIDDLDGYTILDGNEIITNPGE